MKDKKETRRTNAASLEVDALRAMTETPKATASGTRPKPGDDQRKSASKTTKIILLLAALGAASGALAQPVAFETVWPENGTLTGIHTFDDGRMVGYNLGGPNHFESFDYGKTWHPAPHDLPWDLGSSFNIVQTSSGAAFAKENGSPGSYSWDGGRSWVDYTNYGIDVPDFWWDTSFVEGRDDVLYMGVSFIDPEEGAILVSTGQGSNWTLHAVVPGFASIDRIEADSQGRIVALGTGPRPPGGGFFGPPPPKLGAYSTDDGQTWSVSEVDHYWAGSLELLPSGGALTSAGPGIFGLDGVYRLDPGSLEWSLVDSLTAHALTVLADGTVVASLEGSLHRSLDEGITWTETTLDAAVTALHEAPNGDLLAMAHEGVFRSSDSGVSWTPSSTGLGAPGAEFVGRTGAGELLLGHGRWLYRAPDDDLSQTVATLEVETLPLIFGYRAEGTLVNRPGGDYFAALMGNIYFRAAGDTLWHEILDEGNGLFDLSVSQNEQTLVAVGWDRFLVSIDGGSTWENRFDPALGTGDGLGVAITATGTIMVAAGRGVFRSDDQGQTWTPIMSGTYWQAHALAGGEVLVATEEAVLHSADDGLTFEPTDYVPVDPETRASAWLIRPLQHLTQYPGGTLYSTECDGLRQSDDGGLTWTMAADWGHICHDDSQIDNDGTIWLASAETGLYRSTSPVFVAIEEAPEIPAETVALHVYPNPLGVSGRAAFTTDTPGHVRIEVYNMIGQLVLVPVDAELYPGDHNLSVGLGALPGGTYVARLSLDGHAVATRTIVRIR